MSRYKHALLLLVLMIFTSACSILLDPLLRQITFEIRLTAANVNQLYSQWEVFIHEEAGQQELSFLCHVNEGPFCYVLHHDEVDDYDFRYDPEIELDVRRIERAFAIELIDDLGGRSLEAAVNNTVVVRCRRAVEDHAPLSCEVNGGRGWQPLTVAPW